MMLTETSPTGVDVANDTEFWDAVKKACKQDGEVDSAENSVEAMQPLSNEQERESRDASKSPNEEDNDPAEYVEEMEPLANEVEDDLSKSPAAKSPSKKGRFRKCKGGPDYDWQNSSPNSNKPGRPRRSKLTRATSFDGMPDCLGDEAKRLSWDRGSRPKPDFRWDKFMDLDTSKGSQDNSSKDGNDDDTSKDVFHRDTSDTPKRRRRLPRRTKSDVTDYSRPGRVRFCFQSTVCVEVPRATNDMKPDLYYTKREIKEFKAEHRERKQKAAMDKLQAKKAEASATLSVPVVVPIASTC